MTRGTLLFLVVVVSGVSLPVLIFMVFTELRQVFAFDRRLAVPRGQALAAAPRSDTGRRGGRATFPSGRPGSHSFRPARCWSPSGRVIARS